MSEFGKGFVYCLFLLAKHAAREIYKEDYGMWFNGAADHLFDMKIPKQFKKTKIGELAKWLRDTGLDYRLNREVTEEQFKEFGKRCEELMILIDKELGVKPTKAEWN